MNRISLFPGFVVSLSVFAFAPNSADAQFVDYARLDIGPASQRVESGYTGIGTAVAGANNTNLPATALVSLTGDAFTVAIQNNPVSGGISWRDLGDSTSTQPLVRLGEDFLTSFGTIILTLGGLQAGEYRFTSFHIDPADAENVELQVAVTDANGTQVVRSDIGYFGGGDPPGATTAERVNNLTTAFVQASSAVFFVNSNGTNDVVVYFEGVGTLQTPLNGLAIQTVPEPSSALLLSMGGLALARRWRCC
jgi:hypothetical protein